MDVHPIVHSRVPLIKITDLSTSIACDISMENDLSIYKVGLQSVPRLEFGRGARANLSR